MSRNISIKNRKANFEYSLSNSLIAGIVLLGTEIKSIRNNQANISDAHCIFINQELFVRNLHISEYMQADNHEPKRDRKLLLNKQELQKIHAKVKEKGVKVHRAVADDINLPALSKKYGIKISPGNLKTQNTKS